MSPCVFFTAIYKACRQHICAKGPSSCLVQKQPVKGSWCLSRKTKEICHCADICLSFSDWFFMEALCYSRRVDEYWVSVAERRLHFRRSPQIWPSLRHPHVPEEQCIRTCNLQGIGCKGLLPWGHLPKLLQVFFLKEKKTIKQAISNISNNSNLFVNKTSVPPQKSESKNRGKHTFCWSAHKCYDLIHQIQFLMCTCFCLFACLLCCFIKRGKCTAIWRTLWQLLIK